MLSILNSAAIGICLFYHVIMFLTVLCPNLWLRVIFKMLCQEVLHTGFSCFV